MDERAIALLLEPDGGRVHRNLPPAKLVEFAIARGEGILAESGAFFVRTGERTGRSPQDRFVASDRWAAKNVCWGPVNRPIAPEVFEKLLGRAVAHLAGRDRFVFEGFAGADPKYRLTLRVITERAWHTLLATTLFIRPAREEQGKLRPEFTVIDAAGPDLDPLEYGIHSGAFIGISFEKRVILIVGTGYGGEIKKGVFSVMNGLLPERGIFPMHCSANMGERGDVALFFGLSGTGKTTLSADSHRRLIGDDEHGWSGNGVFNFEGGCYAKVIGLSREAAPQIHGAIRFGSILENVLIDPESRGVDFAADTITDNTRATFPLEHIPGSVIPGSGGHPANILFLACDAFGVLPPIARLTPEMAMYHFLSGYTAKVAGTEMGIIEPQATFSACFGAPFLPLPPATYAKMLGRRLSEHGTKCWLVNSGWSGGPCGEGSRMKLDLTRALVAAALGGALDAVPVAPDPVFGVLVPSSCPGVPSEVLVPRNTWADREACDRKAKELAWRFQKNFAQHAGDVDRKVVAAGPRA